MMYCKHCGSPMNENQAVCLQCGVRVGDGKSHCHNCGSPVTESADVCLSCGAALEKTGLFLNGQDKVTMILLCFFVGGFGIHNFLMGESKKGIFKIIMTSFCGIGSILALSDLIKIARGTYKVDPNKLI